MSALGGKQTFVLTPQEGRSNGCRFRFRAANRTTGLSFAFLCIRLSLRRQLACELAMISNARYERNKAVNSRRIGEPTCA